ncbi:hypothetical protein ACOSQ2_009290 [Xanthoceras sorbifolium]
MELSHEVVVYARGVPLVLKILGSFLCGRSKQDWVSKMKKLERTPPMDIQKVLKISYDELEDDEQNIFLDIACFWKGEDKDLVKQFLDAKGFSTQIGITVLLDKSFISISNNVIEMHDLIQAMGREIVRQESIDDPGKRSRLCYHEDIYHVLRNDMGTESIEGISLDMSKMKVLHLNPHAFTKMPKLRFLKFYNSQNEESSKMHFSQGLEFAFPELRYLHWHAFPLKSFPSKFDAENLFVLDMPFSSLEQLWDASQCFDRLKIINLSHSNVTKIPDLSGTPYLESLILAGCTKLLEIPSSIQFLNKLIILNLRDCKSLKCLPNCINLKSLRILVLCGCLSLSRFPEISCNIEELFLGETAIEELPSSVEYLAHLVILDLVNCTRLKSLPSSICKLKRLEYLNISGCSKLNSLPDDLKSLKALKKLKTARTGIREVPSSIACLSNLGTLSLEGCKGLEATGLVLPTFLGLSNLSNLVLSDCNITELPYRLGWLLSLKMLFLRGNNFERIPTSIIHLSKLILLDISCCTRIQSLPTLPRDLKLEAHGCASLEVFTSTPFASSASHTLAVNFMNCLQLEQNALRSLVDYALRKIQLMPTAFCTDFDEDYDEMPRVFICYPGSEIPEWFTFQSMGSFVIVRQLPQGWFSDNLVGFALCAVVAFQDHHDDGRGLVLVCEGEFRSQDGYCHVAKSNLISWSDDYNAILYVGSDHVFLGCDFVMYPENFGENYYSNEFSMQFYLEDYPSKRMECCEVKKCGVRLIYSQDESKERNSGRFGADMEEEEEEDLLSPSKERNSGRFGADMEEEEEDLLSPDPKRYKVSASFEDGTQMEDELRQASEMELLETVSGGDIQSQVLRTFDQHCGRVGNSGEQRLAELEATVRALAAQLNNTMIRECDVSHNLPPEDQDRSSQLAMGCNKNVVATRPVLEYTTPDVLEADEVEFDRDSLLSTENDDELLIKVNNTVDHHHLPWQEDLVVHTSQKVASFQRVEKKWKLNPTIEMFCKLVEKFAHVDKNTTINVNHEEDTFGNQCLTIITLEDCHIITSMTELTVSCINTYIRILYDQLKKDGMLGQFGFINPASVSVVGGFNNAIRRNERACAIANGLQRARQTQLIFMPYNLGFHWTLVVIDMLSMTIYYLDPLRGSVRSDLKNIVQNGLMIYQSQNTNCWQVNLPWKCVQVPRQPGSVECGYYVLRYMKDVIADPSLLPRNFHGKDTYTKEEIDEVCCEWTTFVSQFL